MANQMAIYTDPRRFPGGAAKKIKIVTGEKTPNHLDEEP
jgi:hypothetical protein